MECEANKRLICAAPDLVEALLRLVKTPGTPRGMKGTEMRAQYDQAIAALQKAGAL